MAEDFENENDEMLDDAERFEDEERFEHEPEAEEESAPGHVEGAEAETPIEAGTQALVNEVGGDRESWKLEYRTEEGKEFTFDGENILKPDGSVWAELDPETHALIVAEWRDHQEGAAAFKLDDIERDGKIFETLLILEDGKVRYEIHSWELKEGEEESAVYENPSEEAPPLVPEWGNYLINENEATKDESQSPDLLEAVAENANGVTEEQTTDETIHEVAPIEAAATEKIEPIRSVREDIVRPQQIREEKIEPAADPWLLEMLGTESFAAEKTAEDQPAISRESLDAPGQHFDAPVRAEQRANDPEPARAATTEPVPQHEEISPIEIAQKELKPIARELAEPAEPVSLSDVEPSEMEVIETGEAFIEELPQMVSVSEVFATGETLADTRIEHSDARPEVVEQKTAAEPSISREPTLESESEVAKQSVERSGIAIEPMRAEKPAAAEQPEPAERARSPHPFPYANTYQKNEVSEPGVEKPSARERTAEVKEQKKEHEVAEFSPTNDTALRNEQEKIQASVESILRSLGLRPAENTIRTPEFSRGVSRPNSAVLPSNDSEPVRRASRTSRYGIAMELTA